MADLQPMITLVKKGEIAPRPDLTPKDLALEETLSMLCSFLSIEDFASFLKSEAFSSYAQHEATWLVMEVGLYHDHTKTLQLYPEENCLTLADEAMTGCLRRPCLERSTRRGVRLHPFPLGGGRFRCSIENGAAGE